jgi:hypothetical protein
MQEFTQYLLEEMLRMDRLKEKVESEGETLEVWLEFKLRELISMVEEECLDEADLRV